MQWFRVHHGMTIDPKWRLIAERAEVGLRDVLAVWIHMLDCASQSDERGSLVGWSDAVAGKALDMDANAIERIRTHMNGLVLTGERITAWDRRQPKREDGSAERARAWREAKKAQKASESQAANATERNRTQPNAREDKIRTEQIREEGSKARSTQTVDVPYSDEPLIAIREWNAVAERIGLPLAQRMTEQRKAKLKARLREVGGIEGWRAALQKVEASPFLTGRAKRAKGHEGWKCSLDFLLQESSLTKLMEGMYDGKSATDRESEYRSIIAETLGLSGVGQGNGGSGSGDREVRDGVRYRGPQSQGPDRDFP